MSVAYCLNVDCGIIHVANANALAFQNYHALGI